jgi:hypothetical protein
MAIPPKSHNVSNIKSFTDRGLEILGIAYTIHKRMSPANELKLISAVKPNKKFYADKLHHSYNYIGVYQEIDALEALGLLKSKLDGKKSNTGNHESFYFITEQGISKLLEHRKIQSHVSTLSDPSVSV